jgi:hypothetical protein
MSGAAGIAAAKNRRSKTEVVARPPVVNCKTVNGSSCQLQSKNTQPANYSSGKSFQSPVIDPDSLQIKGPLPPGQILMVHEHRLNKLYDRLNQGLESNSMTTTTCEPTFDAECYDKINELELKIHMLEEVIMNLQLTITNIQSFTMETSLAMLKLQNSIVPVPVSPATACAEPASACAAGACAANACAAGACAAGACAEPAAACADVLDITENITFQVENIHSMVIA